MSAALRLALAQARRRKVQSLVVAVVTLLACGTGVLALNLRTLTDAPYDRAFDAQAGAHLTVAFAPDHVTAAQLRATSNLPAVAATAGPWPQLTTALEAGSSVGCDAATGAGPPPGKGGGPAACGIRRFNSVLLVGRDSPGGEVDRLDVVAGRWPSAPGEVAVRQLFADAAGLAVGDRVSAVGASGNPQLTVTAVVAGVDHDVDGWMRPAEIARLASAKSVPDLRMGYRLHAASTAADVDAARAQVVGALPHGAVESTASWLDVKRQQDLTIEVMAPFLLAFSALGVGAVFLIVVNVVGGAVAAGRRDIGVMKAVGFSPAGVTGVLIGAMLLPAVAGVLAGAPLGVLVSQPLLAKSAEAFDLPYNFGVSFGGVALVVVAMIAIVAVAAAFPAWRAGRASVAESLSAGLAPRSGGAAWLWRRIAGLRLPRPLALGAADSVIRPARSAVTLVAIVVGVAAVVFATGLTASLEVVKNATAGPANAQVVGVLAPNVDASQSVVTLRSQPGVARLSTAREIDGSVPGISGTTRVDAWEGDASWLGYPIVDGRWLAGPGEVVVPSGLQRTTGLRVGDALALRVGDQTLRPRIVGVIFDTNNSPTVHVDAHTVASTTVSGPVLTLVDIAVTAGADPHTVAASANRLDGVRAQVRGENQDDTAFAIIEGVLISLTVVITAVAGLGVFNTVVLSTRERQRHLAVLRAVGMEPRQIVTMVVTATTLLGLIAGAVAIPVGMALHRTILGAMANIAGTDIPASFYDVYHWALLPLLALSGVVIAAAGAALPARWTTRQPVSEVLRAE
ncbi:MAG TPA: ABC transporter permease [Candidatus Dormibacteraeota bacterium]